MVYGSKDITHIVICSVFYSTIEIMDQFIASEAHRVQGERFFQAHQLHWLHEYYIKFLWNYIIATCVHPKIIKNDRSKTLGPHSNPLSLENLRCSLLLVRFSKQNIRIFQYFPIYSKIFQKTLGVSNFPIIWTLQSPGPVPGLGLDSSNNWKIGKP